MTDFGRSESQPCKRYTYIIFGYAGIIALYSSLHIPLLCNRTDLTPEIDVGVRRLMTKIAHPRSEASH